jgi:S-DNA-T family DNA segregation ATPase FtsK/SpoIIIE
VEETRLAENGQGGSKDGPRNLPAVPDDGQLDEAVIDGEIVDEPPQPHPVVIVLRPVVNVVQVVVQPVPRHGSLIAAGAVVAVRRWHQRRTRHERMMRSAEAAGDHPSALEWARQAELERQHRHERRRAWAETLITAAKAAPWIIGTGLILMALLGLFLAIAMRSARGLAWPWVTVAHLVLLAVEVASVAWLVLTIGGALALLAALHHLGRHAGDLAPRWAVAAKPEDEDGGLVVTADTIVLALQNIPVPELKRAFRDGWRPSFTLLPVRDGRGYEAEFSVSLGVTPEMIADRRPVLARNLHREEIETWPSAGAPGSVKLWVADSGAIGKAAPEYPLLHEGEADVFEGVPGGVLARGDGALIPVVAANGVLGGLMGQGKSNAGRVIILGCATDPLCGIDVFVFANNGDFDACEPRLAVYRKGLDDDVIDAAMERLHEAYRDVGEREQMLADLGAKKVTRQLAQRYPQLRPHVSLFSECHELFGHPEYGEEAGELAVKTVKRQRKTGRVAWFDTQSCGRLRSRPRSSSSCQ